MQKSPNRKRLFAAKVPLLTLFPARFRNRRGLLLRGVFQPAQYGHPKIKIIIAVDSMRTLTKPSLPFFMMKNQVVPQCGGANRRNFVELLQSALRCSVKRSEAGEIIPGFVPVPYFVPLWTSVQSGRIGK